MATNREHDKGTQLYLAPTAAPANRAESGEPVLVGELPGVALTDATDTVSNGGKCTVQTDGVFRLVVQGKDDDGNLAVEPGDIVYYDGGVLNVDSVNGTRFGYALDAVESAATTTVIRVKVGY